MKFTSTGQYHPVLYPNDFWLLNEDLREINESVTELDLELHFAPLSLLRFTLYTQMDESFSMQRVRLNILSAIILIPQSLLGAEESESEDFKRVLLDNNPYILLATFVISLVHMVLDTLAFKNGAPRTHLRGLLSA